MKRKVVVANIKLCYEAEKPQSGVDVKEKELTRHMKPRGKRKLTRREERICSKEKDVVKQRKRQL